MSLKNRVLSIFTVALATLAFGTITFAQDSSAPTAPQKDKADRHFNGGKHGGHGEGFEGRGGGMMRMLHGLNLTDAQKTQIKSILEANKPDQANRAELHTLFDAKRAGTLTAEQQARLDTLKQQNAAQMKSVHEQIMNILTPEQKTQLEQKRAEMKQRMKDGQDRQNRHEKAPAAGVEPTKEN